LGRYLKTTGDRRTPVARIFFLQMDQSGC
jgi:hypothetical protein